MILRGSRYQTWYALAPSTEVQRIIPEGDESGVGRFDQRMLKPKESLHGPADPSGATARTCAYSEYGVPLIHGSAIGSEAAGAVSVFDDQRTAAEAEGRAVQSSNWVRLTPRTRIH